MAGLSIEHDAVPGRLRLRAPGLRGHPARCDALADRLRGLRGVRSASVRSLTGSVLLHFGPRTGDGTLRDAVAAELDALDDTAPSAAPPKKSDSEWHALSGAEVARRLDTSPDQGLDTDEAAHRLRMHGANALPGQAPPSAFELVGKQVVTLPVLMLVGSATVSLTSGAVADAVATLAVVAVNTTVGYVTEAQAERTIHALMDTDSQDVRVVRNGETTAIAARDLVPGDVLEIRAGTAVPADARVIAARGLRANESALTGESLPTEKRACATAAARAPIGERPGMVYAGTLIAEGRGRALVVATGAATEAAAIQRLSEASGRPNAPIERELGELGAKLAKGSLAACAGFVAVGLLRGYPVGALLKDALALAVAAVPEGLPMVATTTLSLGMKRLERRGILIRDLAVAETIGAVQTLCLDKTGTLTENRMDVIAATAGGTETDLDDAALAPLADVAALNSEADDTDPLSPTEHALRQFAADFGVDREDLLSRQPKERVIRRTAERPWVITVHGGDAPLTAVKGAPEALLPYCSEMREGGENRSMEDADRERILALNERLAARPARVLALARRDGRIGEDEEIGNLTFLGLLGMVDPVRDGAKEFVAALHCAGVETVLITGDQAATAEAVARELDLSRDGPLRIIDSAEIGSLDPDLLGAMVVGTHVFSRVSSHQKRAIVTALQRSGRIVAMTGDGVNDGPALNAADVGIAMGASGTNLAREVANVVITDDRLSTLITSIEQGRAIYRNIRRALEFLITTNMSEIVVSIAEAAEGPGSLETAMELLWINLVTDVLPGLGLALADPDQDVMQRPPRDPQEPVIPDRDVRRMGRDAGLIAACALTAHMAGTLRHGSGPQTRGMTFLSLSLGQLLYTLACQRTDPRTLGPGRLLENRTLDLALITSVGLAVAPYFVPGLRRLLGIAPLGARDTALSLGLACLPVSFVLTRRGTVITRQRPQSEETATCATSS